MSVVTAIISISLYASFVVNVHGIRHGVSVEIWDSVLDLLLKDLSFQRKLGFEI